MSNNNEPEAIQFINLKLNNRRVSVIFYPRHDAVMIKTKRLVSFKDRIIAEMDVFLSKETLYTVLYLLGELENGSEEFWTFLDEGIKEWNNEDNITGTSNIDSLINA